MNLSTFASLLALISSFFLPIQSHGTSALPSSKIDALLAATISDRGAHARLMRCTTDIKNTAYVDAWITLSDPCLDRAVLKDSGVIIRTDLGRILTACIPLDQIRSIAEIPQVAYLESSKILRPCLDRSVPETRADQVWQQLGLGNRGRGVIVGIIDSGIDYRYGDFRTNDDQSRILAIWDQLDDSGAPPGDYDYGTFWDKASLDQKTCTHIPRRYHGTHVAGIAAGDGSETGNGQPADRYVGVAPEADLLVVNHEDDVRDTQILDAVNWIFQTAGAKPVSVNMSFAAHYGLHDGSYTLDQALDLLVGPGKPGKVICASAGNEGSDLIHAKTTLTGPKNNYFPYLRVSSADDFDFAIVQAWYPVAQSAQTRMWIPKDESGNQYVMTNWVSKNGRHVLQVEEGVFKGIRVTVDAREAPYAANSDFNLITFVIDKNGQSCSFQKFSFDLELDGQGTAVEAWVAMSSPGVGFVGNPNDLLLIQPDSEITVGTPASAQNVIAVASYVTKNSWVTVDGNRHEDSSARIGEISTTSSRGPLRNGGRKPEIAAPGQYIVSAWQSNIQPDYGNRRSQSVEDGKHFIDQGTSMASPHVCGAAALMLQKNPGLDASQIKQILIRAAIDVGGDGWDGRWGAGKMDVKAAWDAVPTVESLVTPTWTPTIQVRPTKPPIVFPTETPTPTQQTVPTPSDRWLHLASIPNGRDAGGYSTQDGMRIPWGVLYRSDQLSSLTQAECDRLQVLGIKTIIDLRADEERTAAPDAACPLNFATYKPIPLDVAASSYEEAYRLVVTDARFASPMAAVFRVLADPENVPVLIHCSGGKDRTGIIIALIHLLLGVHPDDVIADFLLSRQVGALVEPGWIQIVLNQVEYEKGIQTFFKNRGIGADIQQAVRANFLQPSSTTPPTWTPSPYAPPATPTWTPTPYAPPTKPPVVFPTSTPTQLPIPTSTPPAGPAPQPVVIYEFDRLDLASCGWKEIPGGFTKAAPGQVSPYAFVGQSIPSSQDQVGLKITVNPKEVAFIHSVAPVETAGGPVLIRARLRADAPAAAVALAALKGNLVTAEALDWSIATHIPASAASFVENERCLVLLYEPDSGGMITPILQVAATGNSTPVTVWVDKVEAFQISKAGTYPGLLFYAEWGGAPVVPSPTPLTVPTSTPPSPTQIPTVAPTLMPTPTAVVQPTSTPTPTAPRPTPTAPKPIPTPTQISTEQWILLATDPPNDSEEPLLDIHQLFVRFTATDISFRITTYNPWPNEEFRRSQGLFEVYVDTDNNEETGDPDSFGADSKLTAGPDLFTEQYTEAICQWSDPEGIDLWDFYETGGLRNVNVPNSTTLELTVERSKIGNPSVINVFASIVDLETFAVDECPDSGVVKYP